MNDVKTRDADGKFLPGTSGNPNGRPLGKKNQITALKQELELAVRDHIRPKRIRQIIDAMCVKAIEGNVGAAKLILDKVLSNATDTEDVSEGKGTFVFQVKNLTLKHDNVIDITPNEEGE